MAWSSIDLMGAVLDRVDTSPAYALGTRCTAHSSTTPYGIGEFIYMTGVISTAIGSWATLNYDDYTTTLLVDNAIGPVGVAMSASVASTYGWYQIRGKASALIAASINENVGLYAHTVAGTAAGTSSGKSEIIGACSAAASGAGGLTEVEINYPVTGLSAAA